MTRSERNSVGSSACDANSIPQSDGSVPSVDSPDSNISVHVVMTSSGSVICGVTNRTCCVATSIVYYQYISCGGVTSYIQDPGVCIPRVQTSSDECWCVGTGSRHRGQKGPIRKSHRTRSGTRGASRGASRTCCESP